MQRCSSLRSHLWSALDFHAGSHANPSLKISLHHAHLVFLMMIISGISMCIISGISADDDHDGIQPSGQCSIPKIFSARDVFLTDSMKELYSCRNLVGKTSNENCEYIRLLRGRLYYCSSFYGQSNNITSV